MRIDNEVGPVLQAHIAAAPKQFRGIDHIIASDQELEPPAPASWSGMGVSDRPLVRAQLPQALVADAEVVRDLVLHGVLHERGQMLSVPRRPL
jgi:hypothetical protein